MSKTLPNAPQNLDAEESVLGALLLGSERTMLAVQEEGLTARDFYRESHGRIFRAIEDMHERNEPVDAITVVDELTKRGQLEHVGGRARIHELASLVPATANAGHYAKGIRRASGLRSLVLAGSNITSLGYDQVGEVDELREQAEKELSDALDVSATTNTAVSITADLVEIPLAIKAATESGEPNRGLATGYAGLDTGTLRGFWPGQVIVLAARPGLGKSALGLNISENIVDATGGTVLVISLEMSRRELQMRSLARASKVDSRDLEEGLLDEGQMERLRRGFVTVNARQNLVLQDDGATTVTSIRTEARRLARKSDLRLIVVDYLQLLVPGLTDNKANEVAAITRSLKLLARSLDVPILVLSQLNRELERRVEKRPTLSDLRDSGAIEQDADVVLFLYNAAAHDPDVPVENANDYEVIVAKNRKGRVGTEKLVYVGRYLDFREAS